MVKLIKKGGYIMARKNNIFNVFDIPEIQKIGIYAIHNTKTNKYYIGSSVNIYQRMITHARNILRYGGINEIMINDLIKTKSTNSLEFLVIKTFENNTITDAELRKYEEIAIKEYNSIKYGYNKAYPYPNGKFIKNELLSCKEFYRYTKYNSKFDRIAVNLPIGTKDRIKEITGKSCNSYISALVLADLDRLENGGAVTEPPF